MKEKTSYVCSECGYKTPKWMGKCENCGSWNTLIEEIEESIGKNAVAKNVRNAETGIHLMNRLKKRLHHHL